MALAEVCSKSQYGLNARASATEVGPRFIRQTDIVNGSVDWSSTPFVDVTVEQFEKYSVAEGDLLISRLGAGVGMAARVRDPKGAVFAGYLVRFQPLADRLDDRFGGYLLQSSLWKDYVLRVRSGAAQPTLNARSMGEFEFELPPIESQRRIAGALGALDDLIECLDAQVLCLDMRFHAEWRLRFGSLPHSSGLPLSTFCTTQYGYTESATNDPIGPYFVRVADINKRNWIDWTDVPRCPISDGDQAKYKLHIDDLLVARMADPGKSAIVDDDTDAVFASYLIRVTPTDNDLRMFLFGLLKSSYYERYSAGAMTGSVQKNMNAKVITACRVILPTGEEVGDFSRFGTAIRRAIADLLAERSSIIVVRDRLLPLLLSGEVIPGELVP